MKRVLCLLFLVCTLTLPVAAQSLPDLSQKGSISITMRYDGKPVSGGEITLYRVGDIVEEDEHYSFVLTGEFAASGVSLENVQSPETAKKVADYARQQQCLGETGTIDTKGTVTFVNLQTGLYLLEQKKAARGYYSVTPFLISLPARTGEDYFYQIDASPKVSPLPIQPPDNPEQPQTGQSAWPIWIFLISGLVLAMLLCRKKPYGTQK